MCARQQRRRRRRRVENKYWQAARFQVLPLFTSLLNVVCAYDPIGYGLPYNYLLVNDAREPLVEVALHVLIVCLDQDASHADAEDDAYVSCFFLPREFLFACQFLG